MFKSLRLEVRPVFSLHLWLLVPIEAQPPEAIEDRLHSALHFTGNICVLDAHDEAAAVVPGEKPVKQGGPDVAHVGDARRAGIKANANGVAISIL